MMSFHLLIDKSIYYPNLLIKIKYFAGIKKWLIVEKAKTDSPSKGEANLG